MTLRAGLRDVAACALAGMAGPVFGAAIILALDPFFRPLAPVVAAAGLPFLVAGWLLVSRTGRREEPAGLRPGGSHAEVSLDPGQGEQGDPQPLAGRRASPRLPRLALVSSHHPAGAP